MSGDDHFIKPDNDAPSSDISHALRKLYRGQPLAEQAAAEIERLDMRCQLLEAGEIIWREADRAVREELKRHMTNVRHWREECGKLHAQLAKAKADLQAWETTAKRLEEAESLRNLDDGTCLRCGAAPRNASGLCATCVDEDAVRAGEIDIEECGNYSAGSPP